MIKLPFILLIIFLTSLCLTSAHTAEEWRSRSIYQIITDRFASNSGTVTCNDLWKYCGGTFKGIEQNLDYIKSLGFDAIWISPIPSNMPDMYHGYAFNNLFEINPHFGSPEDLKSLVNVAHSKDIWIMVDICINHAGWEKVQGKDFSNITPFNKPEYYHDYCEMIDFDNEFQRLNCRLFGLPDLNQDHPFVRKSLNSWIYNIIKDFKIDGIRLDTVPHVPNHFWSEFTRVADVFSIGEVFNGNKSFVGAYQFNNNMDSLLNYPLYFTLKDVFGKKQTMYWFRLHYSDMEKYFSNQDVLGNFIDNHDNPRFLNEFNDLRSYYSALAFVLTSRGIPIVYYGSEIGFNGGQDPLNREEMRFKWTELSDFIQKINNFRRISKFYLQPQIEFFIDDSVYVFSRGPYLFAFTNSFEPAVRFIDGNNYEDGQVLCNLFYENDCVAVRNNKIPLYLNNGEVKIFIPQ
ncbi:hypothetical protein RCL1_000019 [Eukaryota sp. TZLM3-RCL]